MQNCIIANFDNKEYIRPEKCGEDSSLKAIYSSYYGILQVLAILLADGNDRGAGDLRVDAPVIGSWKGSRIALIDDVVVDANLSEPGVEDVPLYKQITSLGKDVTETVIAAFEGADEGLLSSLALNSSLPLSVQRKMSDEGRQMLSDLATRKGAIPELASFVGFFGFQPGFSKYWLHKRFEKALLEFAVATELPERYTVKDLSWKVGTLEALPTGNYQSPPRKAVVELSFGLVAEGRKRAKKFVLKFGKDGSLFEESILAIFPSFKFDAPPAAVFSELNPEVAGVLKAFQATTVKEA